MGEIIKEYEKGIQWFADILFDPEKQAQFFKECEELGITGEDYYENENIYKRKNDKKY